MPFSTKITRAERDAADRALPHGVSACSRHNTARVGYIAPGRAKSTKGGGYPSHQPFNLFKPHAVEVSA